MPEASGAGAPGLRRATITRGFLFADLRGYTAFVERHGAHEAAAMLDRYRTLVRSSVAEFDGAEIRTEGDSFYVVFDGASAAIECGLAIVARAEEASQTAGSMPILVGIGIHAGETVETTEGFVGSAVNTAARICAQAGPNEVLVSATVRTLTGGVVDARFVPIGRRRLKGLSEPIQLYRVVGPEASRTPTRGRPTVTGSMVSAIALAGVLVAALLIARPWATATDSGLGPTSAPSVAARASASASASPIASASPSGSPPEAAFPSDLESALLSVIPEADHERCVRASSDDVLELREVVIVGLPAQPKINLQPIDTNAGIECSLGGFVAPDTVWYWDLRDPSEAVAWIAERGGVLKVTSSSCATETPAIERWEFGGSGGRLFCYTTETGDAVLVWSYDDNSLMGKAVRDDRDMAAALRWWSDEARFVFEAP